MTDLDAQDVFNALRETYLRYYETAYRLRDPSISKERRSLLDVPGGVYTEPYVEIRPQYVPADGSLEESCHWAGASKHLAEFVQQGLFPPEKDPARSTRRLYAHQERALASALTPGRNVVVTAGTGSGKTEAFLLPIISDLLTEMEAWQHPPAPVVPWWKRSQDDFTPLRRGGEERQAAVRALILYPTNALVDDQLVRLRRALDSESAHAWLDDHGGHRFYFGRYTGSTPVLGKTEQRGAVDSLREIIRGYEAQSSQAVLVAESNPEKEDVRYFAPRPGGAEMLSRWDMYDAPPDILISNHSMLNIMLLRKRDEGFFTKTAQWLQDNPDARFTLVLDELHMHRGTAGTEVAYLVRNLRRRLGITDKPHQLRIIATTASLDADRDRAFPEEFFALDRGSFDFIPGELVSGGGRTVPLSQSTAGPDDKIRAHYFFRNVPGMWACTDPECSEVAESERGDRAIGALYSRPRTFCRCGSRVLELLFCRSCGDVFLGGYAPVDASGRDRFESHLLPDTPDISRIPDLAHADRTAQNYVVYWPSTSASALEKLSWERGKESVAFAFRRSLLSPRAGTIKNDDQGATGLSFHIQVQVGDPENPSFDLADFSPFPTACPACGADWERRWGKYRDLPLTHPDRQMSPISPMRTGFEKINQVLASELAAQLDHAERKLIVFSDSRQNAAKLSSGLALRHYQDLVRIFALSGTDETTVSMDDVEKARHDKAALAKLSARDPQVTKDLRIAWLDDDEEAAATAIRRLTQPVSLNMLAKASIGRRLLELKINPAGPQVSMQKHGGYPWHELYEWTPDGPRVRSQLSEALIEAVERAEAGLLENAIDALFSGSDRDLESLGLGRIEVEFGHPETPIPGLGQASLRILAELKRFELMRDAQTTVPGRLNRYWKKVSEVHGLEVGDVRDQVDAYWKSVVKGFVIDPRHVVIRPSTGVEWPCTTCGRRHQGLSAGVCTACRAVLPPEPRPFDLAEEAKTDYYAWKAFTRSGAFRLNSAELTGQVGKLAAQSRQARFQGVFLDGGSEPGTRNEDHVDGLEVLSVTTTMEAGVDIGPLSVVMMANMPPTRFNYQQRVGRAGRRDHPVAVALTVCRGRSHDEHYFRNPAAVTNDPVPAPYLALDRPEILDRAMAAEVLRMAFRGTGLAKDGASVHGPFGKASEWPEVASSIREWCSAHPGEITQAATAFTAFTAHDGTERFNTKWIARLFERVDETVGKAGEAEDLGERLAHLGVLPMFGFPTRVRNLYLERPRTSYPWPPEDKVDRDLALAISSFAPGAEIVRDGSVYPVIGVTDFQPTVHGRPRPIADPLQRDETIWLCPACGHLDTGGSGEASCPICLYAELRSLEMKEPAGFRAGDSRDFDGNFAWSGRTVTARAVVDLTRLRRKEWAAARVHFGPGDRYVVNDNRGAQFRFRRADDEWGGYIETRAAGPDAKAKGGVFKAALGAVLPTDFLLLSPRSLTNAEQGVFLGLRAEPEKGRDSLDQGRRAAWFSLASVLRTAAAAFLDIDPTELVAGVHPARHPNGSAHYAFLADSLENGAGFSTHLGEVIEDFASHVGRFLDDLTAPSHADGCQTSCYGCLRDYENMVFHPLLDWRLGADLFALLTGGRLQHDEESAARERLSLEAFRAVVDGKDLGTETAAVGADGRGGKRFAVVVRHPLEAQELMSGTHRLAAALQEAERFAGDPERVIVVDWFTASRNPLEIVHRIRGRARKSRRRG